MSIFRWTYISITLQLSQKLLVLFYAATNQIAQIPFVRKKYTLERLAKGHQTTRSVKGLISRIPRCHATPNAQLFCGAKTTSPS